MQQVIHQTGEKTNWFIKSIDKTQVFNEGIDTDIATGMNTSSNNLNNT